MIFSPHKAGFEDWNAACQRLEDYLGSYLNGDQERIIRLTLEILDQARAEYAHNATQTPVQLTMRIAMDRADAWFVNLSGGHHSPHSPVGARGRAVWLGIEGPRKWPSYFLAENPPEELLEAARRESLDAGPGLEFTSLLRREVNYGAVEDIARETWEKFSWSYVLRAFLLWVAIFFAAWAYWLHTHP